MTILEELKKYKIKLFWMLRRLNESRGFVSRRIIVQLSTYHTVVYGTSFTVHYEKFSCIMKHEDVMVSPDGESVLWKRNR